MQYAGSQPAIGGEPVGGIPVADGAIPDPDPVEQTELPPPIPPLAGGKPLRAGGQWQIVVAVDDRPAVMVASVRPDEKHTSFVVGPRDDRALRLGSEYLADQPERNIGLDELAAVAGVGKLRLIRLFREHLGLSPHAVQLAHRVRTARRLLEAAPPSPTSPPPPVSPTRVTCIATSSAASA